jgi:hypothetical protein
MMLISREVRYSATLMRYLNSRIQSCYCAPMICYSVPIIYVFEPKILLGGLIIRSADQPSFIAHPHWKAMTALDGST